MVKYNDSALDTIFAALADPTRRGILAALAGGGRPVSVLAAPVDMSLPGFMKHLRILENAGLVECEKAGRVVTCALSPEPLRDAAAWIDFHQAFWETRLDALARQLEKENTAWPQSSKSPRSGSSAASRPRRKKPR